ncbi:MAG TPA: HAD family hydrolase [Verrucomicrobiae bacterium]|nr:HAD family hydrolase [Verrucomicrobiae bacterium]
MSYSAVIYDCDGVMFDSFEANFTFYQRIMEMMERPPLERGDSVAMRVLHTWSNRDVLAFLFPEPRELERALQCAAAIRYADLVPMMVMEEGFVETLECLKGRVELAVCTNRTTSMDLVMETFGLGGYFSLVMTAEKAPRPKPHPDPLLCVLEHFGLRPQEALFVGDSEVDRQAAQAAGVPFAAYRADLPALARLDRHSDILRLL